MTLANNFIIETELTKNKIEAQKDLEQDLTDFLVDTTEVRIDEVERWANETITRHGKVAQSLRNLISLQSQVSGVTGQDQFAEGGFVGAGGGQVHAGEFVIPANLVSRFSGLVGKLENVRTGGSSGSSQVTNNTPITINPTLENELDFRALGRELAFELRGL